jgi:hypothetical protein
MRMRWAGHEKKGNAYRLLAGKPEANSMKKADM